MAVRTEGADARMRRYSPLLGGLVALALALFVLPSALNVPMTSPSQTLEFAPIPPEDDQPPPQDGANVESLSLGSSSGPAGDGAGGGTAGLPPPSLPDVPLGTGDRPTTKRCVGNPPRQTEDPLSPPCVAYFDGDNGGSTYRGVTGDEVRIIVYLDATYTVGPESDTAEDNEELRGRCFDMGIEPEGQETITRRYMRAFQRYFNDRYQTYDRFVRFFVCHADSTANETPSTTPEKRRADAAMHLANVDPFAVVMSQIRHGMADVYTEAMAREGVLVFGSPSGSQPAEFYRRFPGLVWSYLPSIEELARLYGSYVCTRVVGHEVVDSGNAEVNGQPRRLGWLSTTDPAHPELVLFAEEARRRIDACGADIVEEGTFPKAGSVTQRQSSDPVASYATRNIAAFQAERVTTILWAGGYETDHGKAADAVGYYPELIIAGDGLLDGNTGGLYQNQNWYAQAWTATPAVRVVPGGADPCRRAIQEAEPNAGERDMDRICSFSYYRDLRQLFTGIQVAGPRLNLQTVDQGFHAIPGVPSDDPTVAACFYNPGDYTCVKDGTQEHWDVPANTGPSHTGGCWRMVEAGRRYVADGWPAGNINEAATPSDVCNEYSATPVF
ncbi:MAG TPA: hypothetical protein VGA69_01985 [Nitriliruptorales bacterium]